MWSFKKIIEFLFFIFFKFTFDVNIQKTYTHTHTHTHAPPDILNHTKTNQQQWFSTACVCVVINFVCVCAVCFVSRKLPFVLPCARPALVYNSVSCHFDSAGESVLCAPGSHAVNVPWTSWLPPPPPCQRPALPGVQ